MTFRKFLFFLLFWLFWLFSLKVSAQSVLSSWDIFITTVNTSPDYIEFVSRVDLTTGTVLYMSDRAWTSTWSRRSTEWSLEIVTTAIIPVGTIIGIYGADSITGANTYILPSWLATVMRSPNSASSFNLTTAGDQILIYQGSWVDTTTWTFIYGISLAITNWWIATWDPWANTSYLPEGLTLWTSAFAYTPASHKSIQYTCANRDMTDPTFRDGLYDLACRSGNAWWAYYSPLTWSFISDNPPVVTLNWSWSMSIEWWGGYTEEWAVWIDDLDGSWSIVSATSWSIDTYWLPGTYYLEYTYVDSNWQAWIAIREVIINNPLIPDPQDDYFTGNQDTDIDISLWQHMANDNNVYTVTSWYAAVEPSHGTYVITWYGFIYTPNTGFAGTDTMEYAICNIINECWTATITFIIIDTESPTLTLSWSTTETREAGTAWTDPGYFCTDNVTCTVSTSWSVDTNTPWTYIIEYTATDPEWNTTTETRTVIIEDNTWPVVTLSGSNSITMLVWIPFTDPGATWTDNVDWSGIVTIVSWTVDTNTPWSYILEYIYIDVAGNTWSTTRTVFVQTPTVIPSNPWYAWWGGGSNPTVDDDDIRPVDLSDIINPTISPDTCFSPFDRSTIDQWGMTTYQKIAHQMLYSYGLTTISGTLDFEPSRDLTRAEAAKFFVNFAQNVLCRKKINTYDDRFIDISSSHTDLQTNIKLSYEYGIFYGYEWWYFKPDDIISRDEIIAVMMRLITNKYDDMTWDNRADNYKKTLSSHTTVSLDDTTRSSIALVLYDIYKNNKYTLEDIGYIID